MNHILAATDLSAPARHAIERAALLSRQTATPLTLLHVMNPAPLERMRQLLGGSPDALQLQVLDAARGRLRDEAAALQARFGVTASAQVAQGSVLAELAREADACAADLVVCGARGESYMRHLALGSTAERMLARTQCPVLVVKQVAHEAYRRVLVPVDFSPHSLRSVQHARQVAPDAQLVLLHAFEQPFESRLRYANVDSGILQHYRELGRLDAEQSLQRLIQDAGLSAQDVLQMVLHGDACVHILEQEQELNCDLIALGKHGQNLLEDFFLGSVTKHVLAESQCDVLVSV